MLVIHSVDPTTLIPALILMAEGAEMTPAQWKSYCEGRGLMAFAAEQDGDLAGFAVGESCPHRIHIRRLEGDTDTCRLLFDRLVMAAGERNLSGWVPDDRPDLLRMFRRRGFVRGGQGHPEDRTAHFYFWDRNADL